MTVAWDAGRKTSVLDSKMCVQNKVLLKRTASVQSLSLISPSGPATAYCQRLGDLKTRVTITAKSHQLLSIEGAPANQLTATEPVYFCLFLSVQSRLSGTP